MLSKISQQGKYQNITGSLLIIAAITMLFGYALFLRPPSGELITHPTIYLDGNIALDAFCDGNGTTGEPDNPHIIKDYNFTGEVDPAITIQNTDRFLIIKNCSIKSSNGFQFSNCKNVMIENCSFVDLELSNGVSFTNCNNTRVNNCFFNSTDSYGIQNYNTNNSILSNNTCIESNIGISVGNSYNSTILNNTFIHLTQKSIEIEWCVTVNISQNQIFSSTGGAGIWLLAVNDSFIAENLVNDTNNFDWDYAGAGIRLNIVNDITAFNNTLYRCSPAFDLTDITNLNCSSNWIYQANTESLNGGIRLSRNINDTIIEHNLLQYALYGIYTATGSVANGTNCTFEHNEIELSNIAFLLHQARFFNFTENKVTTSASPVWLIDSHNNTFTGNNFTLNRYGNLLVNGENNTFSLNYFDDNYYYKEQDQDRDEFEFQDIMGVNYFDADGIGNYWNNYEPRYPSAANDGFLWDTPYDVASNELIILDSYPRVFHLQPQITSLEDLAYVISTGHWLNWTITDRTNFTTWYSLLRNDVEIENGNWISGMNISLNLDGLGVGAYNFTLFYSDGVFNASEEVWVIITNTGPVITHPSDITYLWGTTNHVIQWTVVDTSVSLPYYSIYKDVQQQYLNSWQSGNPITYDVTGLPVGKYNFTIIANDGIDATVMDMVWVTVQNNAPVINHPADIERNYGDETGSITWIANDDTIGGGALARIFKNGTLERIMSFFSNRPITYALGNLPVGSYNITIELWDGVSSFVLDTVIVTILPRVEETLAAFDPSPFIWTLELVSGVACIYFIYASKQRKWIL